MDTPTAVAPANAAAHAVLAPERPDLLAARDGLDAAWDALARAAAINPSAMSAAGVTELASHIDDSRRGLERILHPLEHPVDTD